MDIVVVLAVLLPFLFVLFKYSNTRAPGAAPGPFQLPLVGSAWAMGLKAEKLHITLSALTKHWGPIFSLRVGTLPIVVITDPTLMKEALPSIKAAGLLRFMSKTIKQMDEGKSLMFSTTREHWKMLRTLSMPVTKNLPHGTPIQQTISDEIVHLHARFDALAAGQKDIHLNPLFVFLTRNIILEICFSDRWDYKLIETDKEIARYHNAMEDVMKELVTSTDFFPLLDIKPRKSVKDNQNLVEEYIKKVAKARESDPDLPSEFSKARDLLDIFLIERKTNPDFDDTCFCSTFRNLLYAGTFTVSDALDWMVLYLCKNPEIQEKAYQEVKAKLNGREPTMNDQSDLLYLDGVIKETVRLRPPAPLALPHQTDAECTIGGYKIEKGSCLLLNIFGIGNSDKYFEKSEKFDPERWIRNPAQVENLLYFGVGPNACLGMPIAKQEMFLAAASLIQRYKFSISAASPKIDDTGDFKVTYNPSTWLTSVSLRK